MVKFVNRVKLNLTTTGTGTVTFGSVVDGFQSLADASVVDSDVVRYTLESGTNYEVGTGTIGLAGGTYTMARSPSSSSESDNSAINLGAGAVCFLTMLAEDVVQVLADLDNVSSTAPAGGQTLSWDSGTNSWVPASPSGGITSVGNYAGLPSSPSETDLAWVQDTKSLYVYDGTEWQRMSIGPQIGPRYTTIPPATHDLNNDGVTATTITTAAIDESGFPITYDWDAYNGSTLYNASSLPPQVTSISESNGVFSLVGSSSVSNAGSFVFRSKASDGVLFTPAIVTVALTFFPESKLYLPATHILSQTDLAGLSGTISFFAVGAGGGGAQGNSGDGGGNGGNGGSSAWIEAIPLSDITGDITVVVGNAYYGTARYQGQDNAGGSANFTGGDSIITIPTSSGNVVLTAFGGKGGNNYSASQPAQPIATISNISYLTSGLQSGVYTGGQGGNSFNGGGAGAGAAGYSNNGGNGDNALGVGATAPSRSGAGGSGKSDRFSGVDGGGSGGIGSSGDNSSGSGGGAYYFADIDSVITADIPSSFSNGLVVGKNGLDSTDTTSTVQSAVNGGYPGGGGSGGRDGQLTAAPDTDHVSSYGGNGMVLFRRNKATLLTA